MDSQRDNRMKQYKENLDKQHEQHQKLGMVRAQDHYNKENLETQHKYNLEIFEKQAALTREIQKKQRNLTIILIIISVLSTIGGAFIGALLPTYLRSRQGNEKMHTTGPQVEKTSAQTNQSQPAKGEALLHQAERTKP